LAADACATCADHPAQPAPTERLELLQGCASLCCGTRRQWRARLHLPRRCCGYHCPAATDSSHFFSGCISCSGSSVGDDCVCGSSPRERLQRQRLFTVGPRAFSLCQRHSARHHTAHSSRGAAAASFFSSNGRDANRRLRLREPTMLVLFVSTQQNSKRQRRDHVVDSASVSSNAATSAYALRQSASTRPSAVHCTVPLQASIVSRDAAAVWGRTTRTAAAAL